MKPPAKSRTPGRLPATEGSKATVRLSANETEYNPNPYAFQVSVLRKHFGLTAASARLIAELHFGRAA